MPSEQLHRAVEEMKAGKPRAITPRELLGWFGYERRGLWIVDQIRTALDELDVTTVPDFEGVYIDVPIYLQPKPNGQPAAGQRNPAPVEPAADDGAGPTLAAPAHRISRLKAANTKPTSVAPTDNLNKAVTLMLADDFSQLPIMTTEREVKGMISWRSVGQQLAAQRDCASVMDCKEPHREVPSTASMFEVIREIVAHDSVLVRDETKLVTGIITAADISEQFSVLAEPFLLLGDIETALRHLIERSFDVDELAAVRDPDENDREISSASDLTFGQYVRLLENPESWDKLEVNWHRGVFVEQLEETRRIRNNVMHFDPDGITPEALEQLRKFNMFLQRILAT